ncbi:ribosome-inactivating family protein [Streptomyces sp. NPDC001389]|uniref:ribosome-inactivating family protein n=1 Tax=Streptomyces sp. NPDC001389 TaxID=3364569 RepID=UPI0036A92CF7
MREHPVLRQRFRRLRLLLCAFLATAFLVPGLSAAPAHGQPLPPPQLTVLNWDVTDITGTAEPTSQAGNTYREMVTNVFRNVGHILPNTDGNIRVTERVPNHLIELRVIDRNQVVQHRLTLYLWADTLYVIGITAQGVHYAFSDAVRNGDAARARDVLQRFYPGPAVPAFRSFAFTGNYSGSDGLDPNLERATMGFQTPQLGAAIQTLTALHSTNNVAQVRTAFVRIIAATAEATRYGWIRERIESILHYGFDRENDGTTTTTLGAFGVLLETHWSDTTNWVEGSYNGSSPNWYFVDNYRPYQNYRHFLTGNGDRAMHHFMALGYQWG